MMFSSNAEITITGDSHFEIQMQKALKLIIDGFGFKPEEFRVREDGCAVFYEKAPKETNCLSVFPIDKENRNIEYLETLVKLYLASSAYNKAMHSLPQCGGDGGCYKGWRMELDTSDMHNRLVIYPWWAFYHK